MGRLITIFFLIAFSLFAQQRGPSGQLGGPQVKLTTTSSSATTYTATASPTLTAYVKDDILTWDIGSTGCTAGAITLNINGLGAKSVKHANGTTDPRALDCSANRILRIAYDGTLFRIVGGESISGFPYVCERDTRSAQTATITAHSLQCNGANPPAGAYIIMAWAAPTGPSPGSAQISLSISFPYQGNNLGTSTSVLWNGTQTLLWISPAVAPSVTTFSQPGMKIIVTDGTGPITYTITCNSGTFDSTVVLLQIP